MPDKLTNVEIKKVLEYRLKAGEGTRLDKEVLDLINRQEKKMAELQELVDEMNSYFPACIDCEGKTKEGVRTDKCVYMIDNTNYCTKRGIKNISAIRNENRELKAEIEKQKDNYMELLEICSTRADIIAKQKAEVEQLTKDKENLAHSFANAVGQKMTAKAEAYKECIEKVKSEIDNKDGHIEEDYALRGSWDKKYFYDSEIEDILDNLLKEFERKENTAYDD